MFLPLLLYGDFPGAQGQLTHKSSADPAEFQTHPIFYEWPC